MNEECKSRFERVKARIARQFMDGSREPIYGEGFPYSRPIIAVAQDEVSGVITAIDVYGFKSKSSKFFDEHGTEIL